MSGALPTWTRDRAAYFVRKWGRSPARQGCVLVLGMHRSGTSAVTRVVSLLGATLPQTVMGAGPGNASGHWEADWIVDLNSRLLAEMGLSWDSPMQVVLGELDPQIRRFYLKEIIRLIRAEYGDARLFVLKDPRISVLLPLYLEAFAELGVAVHPILVARDPDEVAGSLLRRDRMPPTQAYLLWLHYNLSTLAGLGRGTAAIFPHETLTTWRTSVLRLDATLGIDLSSASERMSAEIDMYISPTSEGRGTSGYVDGPERSLALRLWSSISGAEQTSAIALRELKDIGMNLRELLKSHISPLRQNRTSETPHRVDNANRSTATLDEIGQHYGTDKSSRAHDYLDFYESRFGALRDEAFTLLEIGVFRGASIRMWADYFPRARIVGIDYDPSARQYADSRISVVIGNAGDPGFLRSIVEEYGRPRLVIDDASHRWDHQITGLQTIFPVLVPGGHYVIEDIDTSFEGQLARAPFQGNSDISAFDYTYKLGRFVVGDAEMGNETPYDTFIAAQYKHVNSIEYYRRVALINKRTSPRP